MITEEDLKELQERVLQQKWKNYLKNHLLMKTNIMTSSDWLIFIQFVSHMLYMLVAFMCGLVIGYIVGFRNGGDM
jgi:putative flippase GtrA